MKIKIPFRTPSINHLHGHNKFGAFYLKTEAKKLREEIKNIISPPDYLAKGVYLDWKSIQEATQLKVTTEIYEDWYTKKGKVKTKDVSNREKFLLDSVFDAIGIDDKFIFEHTMKKIQSDKEFAIITIEVIK